MDTGQHTAWVERQPQQALVTYEFDSRCVGDRLVVSVSLPLVASGDPMPTLYVLDPVPLFGTVVGSARTLEMWSSGHFPPTVIVGVGYPATDARTVATLRRRDQTPTDTPFPDAPPKRNAGQAAAFLRCLREEVIPEIEARYPVHPTDRTLVGWSFGGLFGLYTLFHHPETFARYLLVSPSIWYSGAVSFEYEARWAEQHADLAARVFLAVGEREEVPEHYWPPDTASVELLRLARMVSNTRAMASRLGSRGYPSLTVESVVFPEEYHPSVIPAAVSRGLMSFFVPPTER